jgi:hypothetical protein
LNDLACQSELRHPSDDSSSAPSPPHPPLGSVQKNGVVCASLQCGPVRALKNRSWPIFDSAMAVDSFECFRPCLARAPSDSWAATASAALLIATSMVRLVSLTRHTLKQNCPAERKALVRRKRAVDLYLMKLGRIRKRSLRESNRRKGRRSPSQHDTCRRSVRSR